MLGLHPPPFLFNAPVLFFGSQFSSPFSCPICWYRLAISPSSAFPRSAERPENSCGSSSSTCFFHWAMWLGCTPYSDAISFPVLCPLIASSATFALISISALYRFLVLSSFSPCSCVLDAASLSYSPVQTFGDHYSLSYFTQDLVNEKKTCDNIPNQVQGFL